jgi:hypothetical protein
MSTPIRFQVFALCALGGCALIDAFPGNQPGTSGGPDELLECDEEGVCSCGQDGITCVGEGCNCTEAGEIFCEPFDTICGVIDEDGCNNASCSCQKNEGDCDCRAEPAQCLGFGGATVSTFEPLGCSGTCHCERPLEGQGPARCACADDGCLLATAGISCTEDSDCTKPSRAASTGCEARAIGRDPGCQDDEECVVFDTVDGDDRGYCFKVPSGVPAQCPADHDGVNVQGVARTVCVRNVALPLNPARCESDACVDR